MSWTRQMLLAAGVLAVIAYVKDPSIFESVSNKVFEVFIDFLFLRFASSSLDQKKLLFGGVLLVWFVDLILGTNKVFQAVKNIVNFIVYEAETPSTDKHEPRGFFQLVKDFFPELVKRLNVPQKMASKEVDQSFARFYLKFALNMCAMTLICFAGISMLNFMILAFQLELVPTPIIYPFWLFNKFQESSAFNESVLQNEFISPLFNKSNIIPLPSASSEPVSKLDLGEQGLVKFFEHAWSMFILLGLSVTCASVGNLIFLARHAILAIIDKTTASDTKQLDGTSTDSKSEADTSASVLIKTDDLEKHVDYVVKGIAHFLIPVMTIRMIVYPMDDVFSQYFAFFAWMMLFTVYSLGIAILVDLLFLSGVNEEYLNEYALTHDQGSGRFSLLCMASLLICAHFDMGPVVFWEVPVSLSIVLSVCTLPLAYLVREAIKRSNPTTENRNFRVERAAFLACMLWFDSCIFTFTTFRKLQNFDEHIINAICLGVLVRASIFIVILIFLLRIWGGRCDLGKQDQKDAPINQIKFLCTKSLLQNEGLIVSFTVVAVMLVTKIAKTFQSTKKTHVPFLVVACTAVVLGLFFLRAVVISESGKVCWSAQTKLASETTPYEANNDASFRERRVGANAKYPVCEHVWAGGTDIVDLAVLSDLAYGNPRKNEKAFLTRDQSNLNMNLSQCDSAWISEKIQLFSPVNASEKLLIVAFRGTSGTKDVLVDASLFFGTAVTRFFIAWLPFLPWTSILSYEHISMLGFTFQPVDVLASAFQGYMTPKERACLTEIVEKFADVQDSQVKLVGHSLGGIMSQKLVADFNNARVTATAFNSPGLLMNQYAFDVTINKVLPRTMNINSVRDPVSAVDPPTANVQTIFCFKHDARCHQLRYALCELWCGCREKCPARCIDHASPYVSESASESASKSAEESLFKLMIKFLQDPLSEIKKILSVMNMIWLAGSALLFIRALVFVMEYVLLFSSMFKQHLTSSDIAFDPNSMQILVITVIGLVFLGLLFLIVFFAGLIAWKYFRVTLASAIIISVGLFLILMPIFLNFAAWLHVITFKGINKIGEAIFGGLTKFQNWWFEGDGVRASLMENFNWLWDVIVEQIVLFVVKLVIRLALAASDAFFALVTWILTAAENISTRATLLIERFRDWCSNNAALSIKLIRVIVIIAVSGIISFIEFSLNPIASGLSAIITLFACVFILIYVREYHEISNKKIN